MTDICLYLTHYPPCKGYKFFFLAEKLREKGFSVIVILCGTEVTGVAPDEFTPQEIENMKQNGIYVKRLKEMQRHIKKHTYKYLVVGTYSSEIGSIIKTARKSGSIIVEIATIGFNDPVEHNADINLMISKLAYKAAVNKRPARARKAKNKHYVGSLMSDDIPNVYTSSLLSTEAFLNKYKIKNRLFVWLPGREDIIDYKFQRNIRDCFRNNGDTLMAKPHPWSYNLNHKFSRVPPCKGLDIFHQGTYNILL